MALIFWRILTPYLAGISNILLHMILVSIFSGFWGDISGTGVLAIAKIVTFYPYYMGGYLLNRELVKNIRTLSKIKRYIRGSICISLAIFIGTFSYIFLGITDHELLPNSYMNISLREPVARISIIIVSVLSILAFLNCISDRKLPVITKAGSNSLVIYLMHRPITLVFSKIVLEYPGVLQILLACIITLIIIILFESNVMYTFIDNVLENLANVLIEGNQIRNEYRYRIIKYFLYTLLYMIFLGPILIAFLKKY